MFKQNKFSMVIVSFIAVFIGLAGGALIMFLSGSNPLLAFTGLINGTVGSSFNVGQWLSYSAPIILCGFSVAFAYKAGLFNIGAEGQFIVGSITSLVIGVYVPMPDGIHAIVALLAGVFAGMVWGFIPGLLKAYYGVHEVVVTIMLNWIALKYTNYLITEFFHTETIISDTPSILETASIKNEFLTNLFGGSSFNLGFFLMLAVVFIYWFILNKTTFGFEIKAVGHSPFAAQYAGVNTKSRTISTMVIAGAFAGLAGAIYALGIEHLSVASAFKNFGFDGIAVALLGQLAPFGILFAGLLIGGLRSGSAFMIGVAPQIVDIMIGLIILTSAFSTIIKNKLFGKEE